jgi:hypothetical protein
MLFSLGSTLLILLVTASCAVRKGLYRSTILFICCLIAAVVAFSYYENVYALMSVPFLQFYGEGLPLILVFAITALVLDLLSEQLLKGAMRLPVMIDRIGGGFLGFWAAMLAVGMMCVSIEMMPWHEDVLGFQRVYRDEERREKQRHLLLRPDEFAVSLAGYLLDNIFGGSQSFGAVHPDLLSVVARGHTRVQPESKQVVPPEVGTGPLFDVTTLMEIEDPKLGWARPRKDASGKFETQVATTVTREPNEGDRYLVAQCQLRKEAADDDNWFRFTAQQVRIVGKMRDSDNRYQQYFAVGYGEARMGAIGLVSPEQPIMFPGQGGQTTVDLVFEVPEKFVPTFVEYKRMARAEVRGTKVAVKPLKDIELPLKRATPPTVTTTGPALAPGKSIEEIKKRLGDKFPKTPGGPTLQKPVQPPKPGEAPKPTRQPSAGAGRIGGRFVREAVFGAKLPFVLSRKELTDQGAEVAGSAIKSGHIVVVAADARGDPSDQVSEFAVPAEVRLLQLQCDALQAGSMYGKALSAAVKTVAQYGVVDDRGRTYFPAGEYRIANMGGQELLELQYDAEGSGMEERALRPPRRIKEVNLQQGSTVVLLYHIPPGTHLVRFSSGPHVLANAEFDATAPN